MMNLLLKDLWKHKLLNLLCRAMDCVGYDRGDVVSGLYPSPSKFNGGTIAFVGVTVEGTPYIDLEAEAKRIMMSH